MSVFADGFQEDKAALHALRRSFDSGRGCSPAGRLATGATFFEVVSLMRSMRTSLARVRRGNTLPIVCSLVNANDGRHLLSDGRDTYMGCLKCRGPNT